MGSRTINNLQIDLDEDADMTAPTEAVVDEDADVFIEEISADILDEDIDPLASLPSSVKKHKDGSITLPLEYPTTVRTKKDGEVKESHFTELTFRRLNGANQRAIASASPEMMSIVAFAQSTGINQARMNALFDKMDALDITNGGRVLNHFLSSGRKTGR